MTLRRGFRLRPWLWAACLLAAPAFPTEVRAQPGYGPDPFWPYNSQYTPYVTPMGPASPEAGQGMPALPRAGLAGANRFQDYLENLGGGAVGGGAVGGGAMRGGGPDRTVTGVGMPYYRSTIDPDYEPIYKREYRPNFEADHAYERRQEVVNDLYLAYFAERDPRKRAALLRQYRQVRRSSASALGTRRESPTRLREAASRLRGDLEPATLEERAGSTLRPRPRVPGTPGRTGTADALRPGAMDPARRSASGSGGGLPPLPPPLGTPRLGDRPRRTPTDVLNRARALEDPNKLPGALRPGTSRRRPLPPPPPPDNPE
ncbi:MAG TPA: hypothetical protein VFF52_10920 [Isosphaeraceae bacterium]|nr:hypothetical protein [Isosphaeraceae bacterium]